MQRRDLLCPRKQTSSDQSVKSGSRRVDIEGRAFEEEPRFEDPPMVICNRVREAAMWAASFYLDAISTRLAHHGESSQRGDETRLTPIPTSRVGFRSVLNNRCAATFVAQRSSQRATRKSTRVANRSRAAASTSLASKLRSDGLLTSLRALILPSCRFGGGSGPAPRVTLLLCGSAPLGAENSDPVSSRTCTTNRPAK